MAEVKSVLVHGTRIAYREAGPDDGPLILLIHGVASQGATWELVMPFLAEQDLHVLAAAWAQTHILCCGRPRHPQRSWCSRWS
ncbi:MAG: hypothetical protein H0T54_06230 [Geodermatophilaceae bacterium]|nr:hypothetical protein [Geodermatophilaceae bacterium]